MLFKPDRLVTLGQDQYCWNLMVVSDIFDELSMAQLLSVC